MIITIRFDYLDPPMAISVAPALPELNALFRAASMTYVKPYTLAEQTGRLSEERAEECLARAYSEGVIVGSVTAGYEDYTVKDWFKWLMEHKEEFSQLRGLCECSKNFEPQAGAPNAVGATGQENADSV